MRAARAVRTKAVALGRVRVPSRQHWRGTCDCRERKFQVILIDANILIYAHVSSFTQHVNAVASVGLP